MAFVDFLAFRDFEPAGFADMLDLAAVVDDAVAADFADLELAFLAVAVVSGFF